MPTQEANTGALVAIKWLLRQATVCAQGNHVSIHRVS